MSLFYLQTGALQTNTYFVTEGNAAVVIDPGADFEAIIKTLRDNKIAEISVLLTHGHFDHIGAVAQLQASGATVYISSVDYELLKSRNFFLDLGFGEPPSPPFSADVTIEDGDVFLLAGHKFRAIATPGHTPGGLCFVMDDKCVFSGDTIFYGSVGRTDLPYGDAVALKGSVKRILALNEAYDIYPGHGCPTKVAFERLHNPYAESGHE